MESFQKMIDAWVVWDQNHDEQKCKNTFRELIESGALEKDDLIVKGIIHGHFTTAGDLATLVNCCGVPFTPRILTAAIARFEWPHQVMGMLLFAQSRFPAYLTSDKEHRIVFANVLKGVCWWPLQRYYSPMSATLCTAALVNANMIVSREIIVDVDEFTAPLRLMLEANGGILTPLQIQQVIGTPIQTLLEVMNLSPSTSGASKDLDPIKDAMRKGRFETFEFCRQHIAASDVDLFNDSIDTNLNLKHVSKEEMAKAIAKSFSS